jgi:hypothetical protein
MTLERGSLSTQEQKVASPPLAHFHVCIQCGMRLEGKCLKVGLCLREFLPVRDATQKDRCILRYGKLTRPQMGFNLRFKKSQLVNGNGL